MRLFLDANVLFSAAQSIDGRARGLFTLAESRHCSLLTSEHAIGEARRNLMMKAPSAVRDFEDLLEQVQIVGEGGSGLFAWASGQGLSENDAPILSAAACASADLLVTGDRRHFGHLFGVTTGGIRVVTLRDALRLVSTS